MNYNQISIIGLSCKLGSKVVPVEDIAKRFDVTTEEIQKKSGITKLHVLAENEDIVDMTAECAKRILQHKNILIDDIDGVFGSSNPTMETLIPTFAVQVAKRLGLKYVIADQIGLGCCGGMQALKNAHNQLVVDANNGKKSLYLVVVADQTSRILDPKNFATSILFSEGCAVVLLSNDNQHIHGYTIRKIQTKSLLTDSVEAIRLKNPHACKGNLSTIEMDGAAIYKFGTKILDHILECAGNSISVFKRNDMYLIPHQPNLRMLQTLMKNYDLTEKQIYMDGIRTIGNTSGSAVFFGLHDALSRRIFYMRQWVILGAFGAELQVGGALLVPQVYVNPKMIIC